MYYITLYCELQHTHYLRAAANLKFSNFSDKQKCFMWIRMITSCCNVRLLNCDEQWKRSDVSDKVCRLHLVDSLCRLCPWCWIYTSYFIFYFESPLKSVRWVRWTKKKRDLKWLLNLSCEVLPFLGWFLHTRLLLCSQKGIFRNVYMNKHLWYVILNAVTIRSFTKPSIKAEDVSYWYLALRRAAKIQFYDFTVLLHLFLIPPSLHSSGKEVCLSITVSRPKYVEMAA